MYLTRKKLMWIIGGMAVLIVAMALTGCGINPGCGGARGC